MPLRKSKEIYSIKGEFLFLRVHYTLGIHGKPGCIKSMHVFFVKESDVLIRNRNHGIEQETIVNVLKRAGNYSLLTSFYAHE